MRFSNESVKDVSVNLKYDRVYKFIQWTNIVFAQWQNDITELAWCEVIVGLIFVRQFIPEMFLDCSKSFANHREVGGLECFVGRYHRLHHNIV